MMMMIIIIAFGATNVSAAKKINTLKNDILEIQGRIMKGR